VNGTEVVTVWWFNLIICGDNSTSEDVSVNAVLPMSWCARVFEANTFIIISLHHYT
jgi:hypothetical protein